METDHSDIPNADSSLEDSFEYDKISDSRPLSPASYFKTVEQQNLDIKLLNSHSNDPLYQGCGGLNPDGSQLPNVFQQSLLDSPAMNAFQLQSSANTPPADQHQQSESPMNQTSLQQRLNQSLSGYGSDPQSKLQEIYSSFSSPQAASISPANCLISSTLGTEAIIYNEATQEYTMNDPVLGARPIKINYQNIINKDGRSYYKIVREQLVPILNQSELPSFGSSSGFQSERSGKENQLSTSNLSGQVANSATFNWTANSSLNQLLLANQDNLCGPQFKNAASSFVQDSNKQPDGKQPTSPDAMDSSILTGFGNREFQLFLANQLTNMLAAKLAAGGEAKSDPDPQPTRSTPIKTSKKTKSSKSAPSESRKASTTLKCPYCPKRCGNKGGLASHLKRHKEERPFACGECPARFSLKGSLTRHSRVHEGKFPFICTICSDKGFNDNESLETHMRTQHGDLKPFACDKCEKRYSHQSSLLKHQKSHGKKKSVKEPAMEVEKEVINDDPNRDEEEAASDLPSDSSEIRFASMLSDLGPDLNFSFQQPDSH